MPYPRKTWLGGYVFRVKHPAFLKEAHMATTALTHWDPLQELENFSNKLSSFFGRTLQKRRDQDDDWMAIADWSPLVDITEDEKEYLIKVEVPEVKKEDIKVHVENGALVISGERKMEKEEKKRKYHRVERSFGSFVRSFAIPEDADASKIHAEYKDGVLMVHMAKSEQAKPKSIEVKVD